MWAGRSPALNYSEYLGTRSFQPAALRALAPASDLWQERAAALASGRLASSFLFFYFSDEKLSKWRPNEGTELLFSPPASAARTQTLKSFAEREEGGGERGFCFCLIAATLVASRGGGGE